MPSASERSRNNIRTGFFVSITLLAAITVIVVISGQWDALLRRKSMHVVTWTIGDGVSNLQAGSDVRVGGLTLGRVSGIEPDFVSSVIEVEFELDERAVITNGARIYVNAALVGSDAWIDITNLGDGGERLARVEGSTTGGLLQSLLGEDAGSMLVDVRETAAHVKSISQRVDDSMDGYDQRLTSILTNADDASADLKELLARIDNEDWPRWAARVDAVLAWTDDFMAGMDGAIEEGTGALTEARTMLHENRAQVDTIVDNTEVTSAELRRIAEHLRGDTMVTLDSIMTRVDGLVADVGMDLTDWGADIGATLGNLNISSQRLRIAIEEIKHAPWKLLHRPTESELQHELLYAAAQSFALASADLRTTSESARRLLERHGDQIDQDGVIAERVREDLIEAVDRFQRAEDRLVQALFDDGSALEGGESP